VKSGLAFPERRLGTQPGLTLTLPTAWPDTCFIHSTSIAEHLKGEKTKGRARCLGCAGLGPQVDLGPAALHLVIEMNNPTASRSISSTSDPAR
jgi:hypothetical protein